jgi:hypothetical protein
LDIAAPVDFFEMGRCLELRRPVLGAHERGCRAISAARAGVAKFRKSPSCEKDFFRFFFSHFNEIRRISGQDNNQRYAQMCLCASI